MKKILLLFFGLLFTYQLSAQTVEENSKFRTGRLVVKWSPAHLVSHFPTFQIALEHRITKNVGLQYDFGPVLNMRGILANVDKDKRGYKMKFQVRYYVAEKKYWKFFVASEAGYNHINYSGSRAYYVTSSDGYDYYQYASTPSTCREKNISLLAGSRLSIYKFCIDFQVGGIGRSILFHNDSPGVQYTLSESHEKSFAYYNNRSRDAIELTGAIRVCYIIR